MISHAEQLDKLVLRIQELQGRKAYCRVTLDIQGGNLLRLVTENSEKVEDISGQPKI